MKLPQLPCGSLKTMYQVVYETSSTTLSQPKKWLPPNDIRLLAVFVAIPDAVLMPCSALLC